MDDVGDLVEHERPDPVVVVGEPGADLRGAREDLDPAVGDDHGRAVGAVGAVADDQLEGLLRLPAEAWDEHVEGLDGGDGRPPGYGLGAHVVVDADAAGVERAPPERGVGCPRRGPGENYGEEGGEAH